MTTNPDVALSIDAVVAKGRREIARLTMREDELQPSEIKALSEWSLLLGRIEDRRAKAARRAGNEASLSDIAELLKDDPEVQRILNTPVATGNGRAKR